MQRQEGFDPPTTTDHQHTGVRARRSGRFREGVTAERRAPYGLEGEELIPRRAFNAAEAVWSLDIYRNWAGHDDCAPFFHQTLTLKE